MARFLVVDDVSVSRLHLQRLLTPYGECDTAEDGFEAVHRFVQSLDEDRAYDVVCLDLMMPQMDGHEALARIRDIEAERGIGEDSQTKVIITTAADQVKHVVRAAKLSNAYMLKPITEAKLREQLESFGIAKRGNEIEYEKALAEILRLLDADHVPTAFLEVLRERTLASLARQKTMNF